MKRMKKTIEEKTANKGITLIALVITIIILLMLAGVAIATLTGENGILTKAKTTKNKTDEASAREKVKIAVMGSYGADEKIDINELKGNLQQTEGVTGAENITELPAKVTVDGYEVNIDENGKVTVGNQTDRPTPPVSNIAVPGEIVTGDENKTYIKNGTAIIPVGFAIVPGADDVEEGLVISDVANDTENVGNQFVWIPVTDETPYVRNTSYGDAKISAKARDDTDYLPDGITDEETAVRNAKGFYISRYEAGKEGTNTLVSKKGAKVWTNITQVNAKATAKTMYSSNTYVKSALISGIQWDVTIAFISNKPRLDGTNKTYDIMKVDSSRHVGSSVAIAGNNEADKVCNIYDLEGNAWEYVAEKNGSTESGPVIARGGTYEYSMPVSRRDDSNGQAYNQYSFHLVLYVV
ncbi:MAG: hypothetical protein HFJ36_07085 [Clostridia bacterium]|nr:hypothetical protein [Clostridia bacterium]